jgi:hypothetical protein
MGGPAEGSVREKLGFGKFGGRWPMWVAGEEEEMRLAVQLGQRAATQGLTNGPSFLWLPNVIGTYLYLYHPRIIKKEKLLKKRKVHPTFVVSLVLAIELQNQISLTIQLSKPFIIDHQAVLMGDFNIFYLQFSPYNLK